MARNKFKSPRLEIKITPENYQQAVQSSSGGCLIGDAIKEQYSDLSRITVDMATIRVSDRKQGERYTYLTPPIAQHLLLAFDQGWPQATDLVVLKQAVQITPITRAKTGVSSAAAAEASRKQMLFDYEQRIANGEKLTATEKRTLGRLRKPKPAPKRPSSTGTPEVHVDSRGAVVRGGRRPVQGPAHPNLLRGRDRHFGAKLADPGQIFRDAVDTAVAEQLDAAVAERLAAIDRGETGG
jgi:hypothetical protein